MSAKKATANEPTNTDDRTDGGGGVATAAVTTEPKDAADLARATVGRIVHMYCPERWGGPRPAIVVQEFESTPRVNVNVFLDGTTDAQQLHDFRQRRSGNTFELVPVYRSLTQTERASLAQAIKQGGDVRPFWAEFPPRV